MKQFGFTAILNNNNLVTNGIPYTKSIESSGIKALSHLIKQHQEDKLFYDDSKYTVIVDGVIFNRKALTKTGLSWEHSVIEMYREKGDLFFNEWRGSFCGVLYDKDRNRYIVFSDHIGSKFLYYTNIEDSLVVGTMVSNLYSLRHENNQQCKLSITGAYLLLTYGYMLDDYTICEQVKKVAPGYYGVFENGSFEKKRYCILDTSTDRVITETEAVEIFDTEFRRAIELEFSHDVEADVAQPLVSLSAGLDSRMVSWVAHEMGYVNQFNITFSQTDYWDEFIPKQIASDLRHEWLFKSLNDGRWLFNIDNVLDITGGNVSYPLQAHTLSLMANVNTERFGTLHTGQLGDIVFSTFSTLNNMGVEYKLGLGAFSTKYIERIKDLKLETYKTNEIANIYHRGFAGANNGSIIEMPYVESYSPFLDWDLMNGVLKVPASLRAGHKLYKKWIIEKYSGAVKYEWEKMGARITTPTFSFMGRDRTAKQWCQIVLSRIGFSLRGLDSKNNMNPYGYYLRRDTNLQQLYSEITEYSSQIKDKELREVVVDLATNGVPVEKGMAITLLASMKKFNLI